MYSWKSIRTFCAVLLLVPIVHLAYLVSREILASLDASPTIWAGEVDSYTRLDQSMALPDAPIVVVGGRRVRLWRGLPDLLAPQPVLMRGIGDATVNDITHYHEQLVSFYDPHAVVLLPGSSEFHIRDNKSAEELLGAVRELVELDLSYNASRQFYVFTPVKIPLYPRDNLKIDETTRLLQQWADTLDQVVILDANAVLCTHKGVPNPDFYRIDGVNLNEQGYLRLSMLLRNRVIKDNPALYAPDSAL